MSYTDSDSLGTILLSKTILLDGTLKLDSKAVTGVSISEWGLLQKGGHDYYYFPMGSSLFALPIVATLYYLGVDVLAHDHELQVVMAAICGVSIFLLMSRIARFFLTPTQGAFVALLFWVSTSLSSSLATAYWSHDVAVLFGLLAIYGGFNPRIQRHSWFFIGLAMFLAYLSRPTLALLSPCLLGFMVGRNLRWGISAALTLAFFLLCFVLFSEMEWQQPLPDYYLPSRLESGEFWVALLGNLISPGRGIIPFSLMLFVLPIFSVRRSNTIRGYRGWWAVAVLWPMLHWVIISKFPHWYGGHCYGPRLMVDVLPALFIVFLFYWPQRVPNFWRSSVLIAVALFSIWVNAYQGLRNPETRIWNIRPNIASHPEHLFDWTYPQFLANKSENIKRAIAYKGVN